MAGIVPANTASGLTIREEKDLGDAFMKAVYKQYDIIHDPLINNYINMVGQKLVASFPPQPFEFHFYVIRQDTYNAFAAPAGHVFIFSGLFETLDNEDELAALLAHEISHVVCRHISQMIEKSKKTSLITMAGVVAGILVGLGGASTAGSALTIGSMAAGKTAILAYTRENEMQADQIGRIYLEKAGYDLNGMLSVLKKIRSLEWFDSSDIPTYLTTHPATEDRIRYLDILLANRKKTIPAPSFAFQRAHTRLAALYDQKDTMVKRFKKKVTRNPDDTMARYGYGLALARNGDFAGAIRELSMVLKHHPDDPYFIRDLGRAYFLSGAYDKALITLENAQRLGDYGPDGYFYLGRTQIALHRYADAVKTFSRLIKAYPDDDTEALYFLGKAFGEQGNLANAHYNLGLYYMKKEEPGNAAFHFKKALAYEKDPAQVKRLKQLLEESKTRKYKKIRQKKNDNPGSGLFRMP